LLSKQTVPAEPNLEAAAHGTSLTSRQQAVPSEEPEGSMRQTDSRPFRADTRSLLQVNAVSCLLWTYHTARNMLCFL